MKKILYTLTEVEIETVRRAASERKLPFDPKKETYSDNELKSYGLVREGYSKEELKNLGYDPVEVTCFDEKALEARDSLKVETPFGSGIQKWQLPIDMMPMRVHQTIFPANSIVDAHVHPENTPDAPGGGLRIVTKGRIFYKGNTYGPGDWFFVPNGVPYEFSTDPLDETIVFYKYAFFGFVEGNRFSHPFATEMVNISSELSDKEIGVFEDPQSRGHTV